jgi:Flp pilus assembly protein TadG
MNSRSWWRGFRRRLPHGDAGSAVVEVAIVTPVVIVLLLVVVALGRYSHGKLLVEQAAAAAARAASLTSSPYQASAAARRAAADTLAGAGLSCAGIEVAVDTGTFYAGGLVSATVTCSADLSSLTLAGVPGSARVTSTSASPLETYRQLPAAGGS